MRPAKTSACLAALLLNSVCTAAPTPPMYTATPVSVPDRLFWNYMAINNAGNAVASLGGLPDGPLSRGFTFNPAMATLQQVSSLPGSDGEILMDINESGTGVGMTFGGLPGGPGGGPAVMRNGVVERLPGTGQAYRINESDTVVGYSANAQWGTPQPTVWTRTGGSWSVGYPSFPSAYGGEASDVNNSGVVVGWVHISHDDLRPAIWTGSQRLLLPSLGGTWAQAVRVNDAGLVACMSTDSDGEMRAYLWSAGQITEIAPGLPGRIDVFDMNQAGDVVGTFAGNAMLFQSGETYDLNTLTSGDFLSLYRASAINDAGQILAMGRTDENFNQLFLLTPVPAPGACSLVVISLFGSSCRRRRA